MSGSHRSVFCLWWCLAVWDKHWPPLGYFMLWARRAQSWRNLWLPKLQLDIQGTWARIVCDRMGKFFSVTLVLTAVIAWHPEVLVPITRSPIWAWGVECTGIVNPWITSSSPAGVCSLTQSSHRSVGIQVGLLWRPLSGAWSSVRATLCSPSCPPHVEINTCVMPGFSCKLYVCWGKHCCCLCAEK